MAWSTVSKVFDYFREALNDELSNIEKSKLREPDEPKRKSRRKSKKGSKKSKRSTSAPIKEEDEPFSPPLSAVDPDPATSKSEPKFQFQRVSSVVTIRSAPPSPILAVRRKTEIPDDGKKSSQGDSNIKKSDSVTKLRDKVSSRSCEALLQHTFPFSRDKLEPMVRSAVKRGELEAVRDDLTKIESRRISDRVKRFVDNSEGRANDKASVLLYSDDSEVVSPTSGTDDVYEMYSSLGCGGGDRDSAIYDEVYFERPEAEGTMLGEAVQDSLRNPHKSVPGVHSGLSLSKKEDNPLLNQKTAESYSGMVFTSDASLEAKDEVRFVEDSESVLSFSDVGASIGGAMTTDPPYESFEFKKYTSESADPIYEDVREKIPPVAKDEGSRTNKSNETPSMKASSNFDDALKEENFQQLVEEGSVKQKSEETEGNMKQKSEETEGNMKQKFEEIEEGNMKQEFQASGCSDLNVDTGHEQNTSQSDDFIDPNKVTIKLKKKKKKKNVIRTVVTEENVREQQKDHLDQDPHFQMGFFTSESKTSAQDSHKDLSSRFDPPKVSSNDDQPTCLQNEPEFKLSNTSKEKTLVQDQGSDRVVEEPVKQIEHQDSITDKQLHTRLSDYNSTLISPEQKDIKETLEMSPNLYDTPTPKIMTPETYDHVYSRTAQMSLDNQTSTFVERGANDPNIPASAPGLIDDEVKIHSSCKSFLEGDGLLVPSVSVTHSLASSPCKATSNIRTSSADDRSTSQQEMQPKNLRSVFKQSTSEMPEKGIHYLAVEDYPLTQQRTQGNVLRPVSENAASGCAPRQEKGDSELNSSFDLDTYKKYVNEAAKKTRLPCELGKENQNNGSVTYPKEEKFLTKIKASPDLKWDHKYFPDEAPQNPVTIQENFEVPDKIWRVGNDAPPGESEKNSKEVSSVPQTKRQKKVLKKIIKRSTRNTSSTVTTEDNSISVSPAEKLGNFKENESKIPEKPLEDVHEEFIKVDADDPTGARSYNERRLEDTIREQTNFPVDAGLEIPESSDVPAEAPSAASGTPTSSSVENKQGGKKSRPTGETTAQVVDVSTTSVSENKDKVIVSVGHQEEKFSCDSNGSIVAKAEAPAMATTDFMLPPQRKVIWPRRVEQQEPKAIPPWAERDAQPPPPPINHYTSPSSTRFTSHQYPYISKDAPSSTPSTRRHLPEASTLTKQTRMSKSESQINKVTKTSGALKGASVSKGTTADFTTSTSHNSLPSTAAFVSPPTATATGVRRGAEAAIDTLNERATCANEMLKLEAQITAGGARAVGQVAKTSCGSSYCGDATSGGRQSSALAQTDQAAREQSAGKVLAEMVTVKPGDGKFVSKSEKMGEGPIKGPVPKSPGGKRAAGNVKVGSGVLRKDDSWRKEGSLKAAQMPPSPRLDSRKYKSEFASSQPVIQQPTIAEQEGELPDAPWRKSPKQPRKPVATSNQATAPGEAIPEALPETAATNVSEQIASTSTETVVAKSGVSSLVSVSEKAVFKSSSVSEISESVTASSKLSESSSSSSLLSSSQVLSNPANLPPHAPIQHKKISGSPRGSPKNSPILPRRGAQCTPPPAPPSSSKPLVAGGVSESVGTFEAAGKTSLGSDAGSESRRAESSSESKSSDTLVSFDQSPPIVLRNTVVPIPDTLPSSREVNESFGKTTTVPPTSLPVSENARVRKNESISFSESVSEISESKESIKSVFDAESAQLSSLASPQGVNLPPPPPPSSNEEDDSVLPPFPPPPPPPPPTFITESQASASSNVHSSMSASEDYVPVPITSRILSFEKQSSTEQEMPEERHVPEIKPVGPWVKKTSTGPVSRPDGWLLSPEEDKTWPQQMKQQPQVQKIGQTDEAQIEYQIEPQFYYEIGNTSAAIQPPPEYDSPHPPAPKPHFYQPHQYQSPAQLQQNKEQGSPQFKKQLRKQPSPLQARKQQPSTQQQSFKTRPQTDASLRQELQQKILDDDGAPRRETRDNQGPCPRPRLGSTSEQINLHYSQAQLMAAPSPLAGGSSAQSPDGGDASLFDPWCDPLNPRVIQFQDVSAAAFKIKSGILNTPCTRSNMSVSTGMEIFFKKEFNQYTGSFKERGARYTLLSLTPEQKVKGVIAASAGNHALALSYHGQDLGIPVTVVMPLVAPIMKVQCCRQYGANILVRGSDIGECRTIALKMAKDQDLVYINGYDHPHILAGQGTMGLEIVEQVPNIDAVVVPVGGGGLIAGVALAVKALYPHIQVIGVESENCPSFSAALKNGSPVYTKPESTLADGLAVPLVGVNAFATAAPLVDKVVTVREEWIAIAILRLVEQEKAVVEGAGATALAAILAGELPELKGKRVVIPLCGGNIDTTVLGRCLERGLAADGRLVKFTVTVSDRPGGIAELTRLMASLGVSIKDMTHERAWIRSDIFSVEVKALCETRDREHSLQLQEALHQRYAKLRFVIDHS